MTQIPHFALPFNFSAAGIGIGPTADVVEQDSAEDISYCVEAVLRYRRGQREIAPQFGIDDLTFSQGGADTTTLLTAIEEQEPRAAPIVQEIEDELDRAESLEEGIDIIRITLGVQGRGE